MAANLGRTREGFAPYRKRSCLAYRLARTGQRTSALELEGRPQIADVAAVMIDDG